MLNKVCHYNLLKLLKCRVLRDLVPQGSNSMYLYIHTYTFYTQFLMQFRKNLSLSRSLLLGRGRGEYHRSSSYSGDDYGGGGGVGSGVVGEGGRGGGYYYRGGGRGVAGGGGEIDVWNPEGRGIYNTYPVDKRKQTCSKALIHNFLKSDVHSISMILHNV